jgi:hypothetical protein
MDRFTKMAFDIIGEIPKEKRGHRLRLINNKTGLGFRLTCSCGWAWRSGWVGNRGGRDYAKLDGKRAFETHCKEA